MILLWIQHTKPTRRHSPKVSPSKSSRHPPFTTAQVLNPAPQRTWPKTHTIRGWTWTSSSWPNSTHVIHPRERYGRSRQHSYSNRPSQDSQAWKFLPILLLINYPIWDAHLTESLSWPLPLVVVHTTFTKVHLLRQRLCHRQKLIMCVWLPPHRITGLSSVIFQHRFQIFKSKTWPWRKNLRKQTVTKLQRTTKKQTKTLCQVRAHALIRTLLSRFRMACKRRRTLRSPRFVKHY